MPWRVIVNPHIPVIETCYSGVLTQAELSAAVEETISLAGKYRRNRFLADCTELDGGHSFTDLFFLADFVLNSDPDHLLKEAVITNNAPVASQNASFWETTCLNRGLKVRLFSDRQSAIDWLVL
ncbi:MAG: hypothetical protein HGA72_00315 [Chlorobiaceae bacterium]|jgi:hypothetical protein|nr:hypothetical protein [Chlorobiaceae bacterium]NTW63050.1 hypothetical protein [Chlorobiaceae bacterium]